MRIGIKFFRPFSFFFALLVLIGCGRQQTSDVTRLIDRLDAENILSTPFTKLEEDPEAFKRDYPALHGFAATFPMEDAGIGENPYLIKKKIKIGPVELNSLLAPPRSHFTFQARIPERGILEFFYGIRRDEILFRTGRGSRTARFQVALEVKGRRNEIFKKILRLPAQRDLIFNYKEIDLSEFAGETATFTFLTLGDPQALACWFNPVLYRPHDEGRNIILISLDTLRADHLSCYGYPFPTSPNMDLLAEEGTLFQNHFTASPWTLPSHISLMTGMDTLNHQVYNNRQRLSTSIPTLADYLRKQGYFTGAFTGGGYVSGIYGFSKGFDSYHIRGQVTAPDAAHLICQGSMDWIERHKKRNFFLFIHTYQIHNPYFSPAPYNEMFLEDTATLKNIDMSPRRLNHENRFHPLDEGLRRNIIGLYDGELRYTDEILIKPLIDKLKALGLYDRTMIVLTADHGDEFFDHEGWGHTHSVYNELIRVPLIIKFFGSRHKGETIDSVVRQVDVMPTILDELGIDTRGSYSDGKSLLPMLAGQTDQSAENQRSIISDLAYHAVDLHMPKRSTISLGRYKLIVNTPFSPEERSYYYDPPPRLKDFEVYDMKKDASEINNLAQQDPALTRRLYDFYQRHYRQKREGRSTSVTISEETKEQLRALGYIK